MTHAQSSTPRAAMFVAAIGLLGLGCDVAPAADARVAYLPMTFHAESQIKLKQPFSSVALK